MHKTVAQKSINTPKRQSHLSCCISSTFISYLTMC